MGTGKGGGRGGDREERGVGGRDLKLLLATPFTPGWCPSQCQLPVVNYFPNFPWFLLHQKSHC